MAAPDPVGLTASVADLTLASVAYQNAAHDVTGTMTLTADDSTGSGAGWNVTIQSSALVWVGTANGGIDIPAADFALTSAAAPAMIAGQAVSVACSTGQQVRRTSPLARSTPRARPSWRPPHTALAPIPRASASA